MSHKEVMRSAIGAFHEKDTTCEIMFGLEALDAKFGIYANFSSAPLPSAHTFSRELRFLGPWIHVGVRVRGWCACVCVCVCVCMCLSECTCVSHHPIRPLVETAIC